MINSATNGNPKPKIVRPRRRLNQIPDEILQNKALLLYLYSFGIT